MIDIGMYLGPEDVERLSKRVKELEAERDNYKQKTEALIKSHHELSRMIDKLWAEVQGLRGMFWQVQEALNPQEPDNG